MDKNTAYARLFKLASAGDLVAEGYITRLAVSEDVPADISEYLTNDSVIELEGLFKILKSKPLYNSLISSDPHMMAKGLSSLVTHLLIDIENTGRGRMISDVFDTQGILQSLQDFIQNGNYESIKQYSIRIYQMLTDKEGDIQ